MVLSGEARDAFAIEKEANELRDKYGRTTFGQSCLLARRLVERGVMFVTVSFGGWDHHAKIWPGLESKLPDFDRGFSSLISDMHERGLLKETMVVMMGEFGRTPKINPQIGRDHFPNAWSSVLCGGGIKGGQVVGKTSEDGMKVDDRPVSVQDLFATMCKGLGLDAMKQNVSIVGRPIRLADPTAKPITEIVG